jgi:outer membrane murein-binding lipoprotein Lpp
MQAVWVALIVAAAAIAGPLLVGWQHNRRLDRLAEGQASLQAEVAAVKTQTDGVLTAAFRSEIAAVEAQVVAMKRPSPDTQAAIRATELRLAVMRKNLTDRETAVGAAQLQIANEANNGVEA